LASRSSTMSRCGCRATNPRARCRSVGCAPRSTMRATRPTAIF
jgi:hypothetical protein